MFSSKKLSKLVGSSSFFHEKQRELTASHPPIHYIWIGPKQDMVRGVDLQGQDIDGPIAMAKRVMEGEIHNPLHFWCLEAYLSKYTELLHPFGIQVHAVEGILKQYADAEYAVSSSSSIITYADAARFIQQIMRYTLTEGRNKIIDKVNIKNLFSLFLLLTNRAYVLDTNITPTDGKKVELPVPEKFTYTILNFDKSFQGYFLSNNERKPNIKITGIIDFFMMFSPHENDLTIQQVFARLVSKWPALEDVYKSQGYCIKFHTDSFMIMANSIAPDSLYYSCSSAEIESYKREDYFYFSYASTSPSCNVAIFGDWELGQPTTSFGLEKTFNNTHKKDTTPCPSRSSAYYQHDTSHRWGRM